MKLLRDLVGAGDAAFHERDLVVVVSLGHGLAERLGPPAVENAQVDAAVDRVITSYSIHYTKLYDDPFFPMDS